MKLYHLFGTGVLISGLSACGGSSSSSGAVVGMTAAFATLNSSISNVANLKPGGDTLYASPFFISDPINLEYYWTGNNTLLDETADGNPATTLKEYMGIQLDSEAARAGNNSSINIFGRFNGTMSIPCAVTALSEKGSDGYPANGSQSITINSDSSATLIACGIPAADVDDMDGAVVPIVVSDTSDTSVYAKKIVMTMSGGEHDSTQTMYFKTTDSEINIASVETYEHTENSVTYNHVSRTLVGYNASTQKLSVEYLSTGDNEVASLYLQRLFYDGINDVGAIYSRVGATDDADDQITYTLKGKPESKGTLALSLKFVFGGTTFDTDTACVNIETGAIATHNSLACSLTGKSIDDSAVAAMAADAFAHANDVGGWVSPSLTSALSFSDSTIFTQNTQH